MMQTATLTRAQHAAFDALPMDFADAATIGATPTALTALVGLGLADRAWSIGRHTYKVSEDGMDLHSQEYRAERRAEMIGDIRSAYESLRAEPGAWVGLARLRAHWLVRDAARVDVDAALLELALQDGVHINPEFNQKTLTPADRDAALRMGGEDCHLLAIGRW